MTAIVNFLTEALPGFQLWSDSHLGEWRAGGQCFKCFKCSKCLKCSKLFSIQIQLNPISIQVNPVFTAALHPILFPPYYHLYVLETLFPAPNRQNLEARTQGAWTCNNAIFLCQLWVSTELKVRASPPFVKVENNTGLIVQRFLHQNWESFFSKICSPSSKRRKWMRNDISLEILIKLSGKL